MGRLLKGIIVLFLSVLVICTAVVNIKVFASKISSVEQSFEEEKVVPDVVLYPPPSLLEVKYPSGVEVMEGNELTPTQVKDIPTLWWEAQSDRYYTIIMTDPDAPSRDLPILRELQHWLVGNVLGTDIASGETLTEYVGAGPSKGTGLHRYTFLVYSQPRKLDFNEPRLTNRSNLGRTLFSTVKFAEKYEFCKLVAGNFFEAEYDDYVPVVLKQLGIL